MKMQIAVEYSEQVAGVDRCGELIEIAFGDGERENADGHDLQLLAHRIDLPHLLWSEIAHNGAAVRNALDNSLLLQFEQSEAHIAAMGVEALAEILLDQVLARMASAEDDVLFQTPRDYVGDAQLVMSCARCLATNITGHRFPFGRPSGHGNALLASNYVYNIKTIL